MFLLVLIMSKTAIKTPQLKMLLITNRVLLMSKELFKLVAKIYFRFIGPVMPPSVKSIPPSNINGSSEKAKKTLSTTFSNSTIIKPKMMTIKIGKETITKKELTTVRSISSPLVPYTEESSDDDCNNNEAEEKVWPYLLSFVKQF